MKAIELKTKFFEKKIPFGSNKKLLSKALKELGWQNKPVSEIDPDKLSVKMIELYNRPMSKALDENQKDQKQGFFY